MINQEGGAEPGEGLTALQTFTYFFAAPVAIFTVIALLSWFASAPKKAKKDVINRIDDEDDGSFITMIA
ncbi:7tmF_FZD7 domain containing protein [Candidatus Nanopelagicaceae bacterium]